MSYKNRENSNTHATFTYDETDKIVSRKNADGTVSLYKYDGAGNLVQQVNYNTNGTILDSFSYVYDNKGRITSVTSNAGTTSYVYDALDQLTKETHADGTVYDYTYDEVGNRLTMTVTPSGGSATTTTYHYDDANEISDVNGTSFTYDANGNLTNDGNHTYVYDNEDSLIAVKDTSGNTLASYTYDSKGLRKTMTTSAGTTTFHYDENNNVAYETDSSNNIVASYTWNGNEPVSMTRGGQTYYYQLNGHGDVVALTDSTGAVVNTYDYDAFGNLVKQTGTVANPYLYAGYRFDKETGLYYLQARYYDAKNSRFLTLDPDAGDDTSPLSQNGYSYVENNPVMKMDPNGTYSLSALSPKEKMLTKRYPISAAIVYYCALQAWYWTGVFFHYPKTRNTRGDAFRHALWNALMTKYMGSRMARAFATAHEATPENPSIEKRMDLYNNAVGRAIGSHFNIFSSNRAIAYSVRYWVNHHRMLYISSRSHRLIRT